MKEQSSDPVFDYLLEEMLTGQHPPDLTARIEAAWMREKAGAEASQGDNDSAQREEVSSQPRRPAAEHAPAVVAPPVQSQRTMVCSGPNQGEPSQSLSSDPERFSGRRSGIVAILALVASGLLIYVGWRTTNAWRSNEDTVVRNTPLDSDEASPELQLADAHESTTEAAAGQPAESLRLDDLPFGQDLVSEATTEKPVDPQVAVADRLASEELVALVDFKLAEMWQQLDIQASDRFAPDALAQRVSFALTGQGLTEDQIEDLIGKDDQLDKQRLIESAVDSIAFARRWADGFAEQWLSRGSLPLDGQPVQRLRRVLAEKIANRQPWNEVGVELLGGELDSRLENPSSIFVGALAGGGNHRLVKRIGINFLDTNLACVRCHDMRGESAPEDNPSLSQEAYWSMVAMLQGIDARGNFLEGEREIFDNQSDLFSLDESPTVFFELPDGRLKAAEARLPGGSSWTSQPSTNLPREALAQWISQSQWLDQATVNQVWKMVFGRSLVPTVSVTDDTGIAARREVLQLLAEQFRTHDHDLKELVGWIVSSDAFSRQPIALSRPQWLVATDEELRQIQTLELAFAAGPTLGRSREADSLEKSLLAMRDWRKQATGLPSATLAQPAPGGAARKTPKRSARSAMPSLSLAIHGDLPTESQRDFVKRLLRSDRLSWEQRVAHVVGLSASRVAGGRIQQLAKGLLQQSSGDAEAALLDLLWAVQNSDAR